MVELAGLSNMHHSFSRATNPGVLQMYCNLVSWECLSEDVRHHILSWAIHDLHVPIGYGLTNKMKVYVDMFSMSMVVVVCSEVDSGLVVTIEDGRCGW